MFDWYDLDGKKFKISQDQEIYDECIKNKVIAQTTLPNGKWVSTVWVGLETNPFGNKNGPPLIFETMVFENESNLCELDVDKYYSKEEAAIGHALMCSKWMDKNEAKDVLFEALNKAKVKGQLEVLDLISDLIYDFIPADNQKLMEDVSEFQMIVAHLLKIDLKDFKKPIMEEAVKIFEEEKDLLFDRLKETGFLK